MEKETTNKFTWVIKDFSSNLRSRHKIHSDEFMIGGYTWRLGAYQGTHFYEFSLTLVGVDSKPLPFGLKTHAKFRLTVVNQLYDELSHGQESQHWFCKNSPSVCLSLLRTYKLHDCGFLLNKEVKIVAEVDVLEFIMETTQQYIKRSRLVKGTESIHLLETVDVNGFQVLPSQVDLARRIFEKYPNIASEFRIKNRVLKTAYMNVIFNLIETLRRSPQEISNDDFVDAYCSISSLRDVGFKVDWLEKKMNEMSVRKEKERVYEIQIQETEKKLNDLKAKVLVVRSPLALDDVF